MLSKLKYLIILFYILIVWIFPYAPLNDLPNHLASINIINQLIHGNVYLSEIFDFDLFKPSTIPHLIILFLMQFMHILIASKIFLTIYILLYLFSMEYFFKTFSKPKDKEFHILISLLFIFNVFFYMGLIGFFFSLPFFFIFFTYLHKNKSNFMFLALSLVVLLFIHIISALIFLLVLLFFNFKYLKNPKFYLSLLPILIILFIWISNSSFSEVSSWENSVNNLLNFEKGFFLFIYKFYWVLAFSFLGLTFILIYTIYLFLSKYKFNIKNKYLQLSLLLLLIPIILPLPDFIPEATVNSIRFVLFFFPFFIIGIPEISEPDKKLALVILIIFHVMILSINFYVFFDYNENINSFISLKEYIEPESSIQYIFTPSRVNTTYTASQPYLHMHHYITLHIPSVYGSDLHSYWYNPIIYKKSLFSDFTYLEEVFNSCPKDLKQCGAYSANYPSIISDERYPYYDYIIIFADECNATEYFLNEYEIIYNEDSVLLKLKKQNS